MSRSVRSRTIALAPLVLSACTVFNGKTLPADPDAGSTGSACGCSAQPGVLCEDFEGSAWGAAWTAAATSPAIDPSRSWCGHASLHVQSPAFGPNASAVAGLVQSKTFADPSLASGFYARAWVYIPSASPVVSDNYFSLMEVRQDSGDFLGVGLQVRATASNITNWTATPPATVSTSVAFPRDRWTCVEWQVTYGATGASTAWIGDAANPAAALASTNTAPAPPYTSFVLGAFFASNATAQPAFDLWLDDVVLDKQRIGCGS